METITFKYKLGEKARDKVTGLEGILVSRCENLNGCLRYTIQPKVDKEGKYPESFWFDQDQIELLPQPAVETKKNFTGGPPTRAVQNQ